MSNAHKAQGRHLRGAGCRPPPSPPRKKKKRKEERKKGRQEKKRKKEGNYEYNVKLLHIISDRFRDKKCSNFSSSNMRAA